MADSAGATDVPQQRHDACAAPAPEALLRGIEQFNRGLFFEQHETLEDAWLEESGAIRSLYQGILQIGVGFYHLQRGNYRGATSLIERGMGYLRPFSPVCLGVDVGSLLDDTRRALTALRALGPRQFASFDQAMVPAIRLTGPSRPSDQSHD